ncbi:LLM class oxidoreductase [Capnocytophaga sp.]|uniref:LLM class oxidoreductase n=1 Tax=Capnocytophaga sp. TaxID=44737 RepID=UPI0026DC7502|nr:LLM class oxidoreductase [Capnocytophaga sp.]MDO5106060.1 LLM class oxidoreductase [Capnocytophaga sp.]
MIDAYTLSVGIMLPIEAYTGAIPKMENQIRLIQQTETYGFESVWVRDIPLYDPDFNEVGQIFDPWIYLSHIATLTQTIKIGIASVILPLRHPIHVAKASASLDVLFPNRFHLGVASGDRPVEYPAFNKPFELRSTQVSEHIEMLKEFWSKEFPHFNNEYGTLLTNTGDILPKPLKNKIPLYITGHVGGMNLEWIAKNSDGWIYYPRDFAFTGKIISNWREALDREGQPRKPYLQPVYIDLDENPDFVPVKMDLGFKLGRNYLIDMFLALNKIGVNHAMLVLKHCSRPVDVVLDEIGREVLPHLKKAI